MNKGISQPNHFSAEEERTLNATIDRFKNVKLLVIGDVILDIFMYGSVNRISPEAPVPVFRFDRQKEMLGGAGNVAANLRALDCQTNLIGLVGDDPEAQQTSSLLEQIQCQNELLTLPNHPTTVKTRLIASHNHLIRLDRELPFSNIESLWPKLLEKIIQAIPQSDIVLLSDYGKGLFTPITTPFIIDLCNKLEKPVIVDPKGNDYTKYKDATLIKPNLKEFQEATGLTIDPKSKHFYDDVRCGAKKLFEQYRLKNLIVTLSQYGMIYISAQNPSEFFQIPTEASEVFDVSGAGDTSFAVLGAALGAKVDMIQAMRLANLASGIVVAKLGTSSVTPRELKTSLSEKSSGFRMPPQKVFEKSEIAALIAPLREQGKTIGFTNGCFDCMHLGHLNSFNQARRECDVLVVGVNSDASVKRYKGPERPIQDEKTRSMIIAALECVDFVVIFDDDTAEPLVDLIHPDVIAKEGYALENWPEAQKVVAYGGRAVTLERVDGYSTSEIISRMKG